MTHFITFKPPLFGGDGKLSAQEWIDSIDRNGNLARWTDINKLNCAAENLKGDAKRWFKLASTTRKLKNHVDTWPHFKTSFRARFEPDKSALERFEAAVNLRQTRHESVREFFERVHVTFYPTLGDVEQLANTLVPQAEEQRPAKVHFCIIGIEAALDCQIKNLFITGAAEPVASVLRDRKDLGTLTPDDLANIAERHEKARVKE